MPPQQTVHFSRSAVAEVGRTRPPDADGGVRSSLCESNGGKLHPRRWHPRPRGCLATFMIGTSPPAANRETQIEATGKRQVAPTGDKCRRGRSWRNGQPHALLVRMGYGTTRPLRKLGHRVPPHDPAVPPRGVCPREPTTHPHDNASPDVHGGNVHRCHNAEKPPMSFHQQTGKQNVVPARERMLLAREEERSTTHPPTWPKEPDARGYTV